MIGDLLFDAQAIERRVAELGATISRDYAGRVPVLLGVLNASAPFLADLTRAISIPCEYDAIAITKFSAAEGIAFQKDTSASVEGRDVILVEDTIDTGMTLQHLIKQLQLREPASLRVCALLDKRARRLVETKLDYVGFEIPDEFVVGYGLDYGQRFRNLPFVATVRRESLDEPRAIDELGSRTIHS